VIAKGPGGRRHDDVSVAVVSARPALDTAINSWVTGYVATNAYDLETLLDLVGHGAVVLLDLDAPDRNLWLHSLREHGVEDPIVVVTSAAELEAPAVREDTPLEGETTTTTSAGADPPNDLDAAAEEESDPLHGPASWEDEHLLDGTVLINRTLHVEELTNALDAARKRDPSRIRGYAAASPSEPESEPPAAAQDENGTTEGRLSRVWRWLIDPEATSLLSAEGLRRRRHAEDEDDGTLRLEVVYDGRGLGHSVTHLSPSAREHLQELEEAADEDDAEVEPTPAEPTAATEPEVPPVRAAGEDPGPDQAHVEWRVDPAPMATAGEQPEQVGQPDGGGEEPNEVGDRAEVGQPDDDRARLDGVAEDQATDDEADPSRGPDASDVVEDATTQVPGDEGHDPAESDTAQSGRDRREPAAAAGSGRPGFEAVELELLIDEDEHPDPARPAEAAPVEDSGDGDSAVDERAAPTSVRDLVSTDAAACAWILLDELGPLRRDGAAIVALRATEDRFVAVASVGVAPRDVGDPVPVGSALVQTLREHEGVAVLSSQVDAPFVDDGPLAAWSHVLGVLLPGGDGPAGVLLLGRSEPFDDAAVFAVRTTVNDVDRLLARARAARGEERRDPKVRPFVDEVQRLTGRLSRVLRRGRSAPDPVRVDAAAATASWSLLAELVELVDDASVLIALRGSDGWFVPIAAAGIDPATGAQAVPVHAVTPRLQEAGGQFVVDTGAASAPQPASDQVADVHTGLLADVAVVVVTAIGPPEGADGIVVIGRTAPLTEHDLGRVRELSAGVHAAVHPTAAEPASTDDQNPEQGVEGPLRIVDVDASGDAEVGEARLRG
jgi:hypothetical protein